MGLLSGNNGIGIRWFPIPMGIARATLKGEADTEYLGIPGVLTNQVVDSRVTRNNFPYRNGSKRHRGRMVSGLIAK